jgi:hypothetical protein
MLMYIEATSEPLPIPGKADLAVGREADIFTLHSL